jgi:ubiquinone/menaquinone biosynthesis C-methylase UbiE
MKPPTTGSLSKLESLEWHAAYAEEGMQKARKQNMPGKLERLGLLDAPRDISLLDLCCGHGEALGVMHDLGFRNLHGLDITVTHELMADSRFQVQQGDATALPHDDESFDWVTCIHSMHHFASAENVRRFSDEAWRVLKPGGRLSVIDFPASPQILAAFWFFRHFQWAEVTPYMRYFGKIVREEWSFLKDYLPQWPQVEDCLWRGRYEVERNSKTLFYFHLTLKKPA